MSEGFTTGLGIGTGLFVTSLVLTLLPLLVVGGSIYLLNEIFPEEEIACKNGQKEK